MSSVPNGSWWHFPPYSRGVCLAIIRRPRASSSMARWPNYEPPRLGSKSVDPTDENLMPSSLPTPILFWGSQRACCHWMKSEHSSILTVTSLPCGTFSKHPIGEPLTSDCGWASANFHFALAALSP
jgi:hypothetical protein